ncbi:MAG: hypothetical protein ACJ77K_03395 [Bacteroidia bacterium]
MNRKTLCFSILFAGITNISISGNEPDSLGLPGDNLDLQGVLELFKKSASPEEFEKALNTPDNQVNNLDLNNDDKTDYIRVVDHFENGAHALVLQVPVNESEAQDVAVIEIEKTGDETADAQIVGDEDFYGKDYIIEAGEGTPPPPPSMAANRSVVIVNVWAWPCVRFVYAPAYVIWISPWHWHYYPVWWTPWEPVLWHVHHMRVIRYHHPYWHRVYTHRVVKAHSVYAPHRTVSATVYAHRSPVMKQNPGPARKANRQQNGQQKAARQNNPNKMAKPHNRPQGGGMKPARAGKGGGGRGRR